MFRKFYLLHALVSTNGRFACLRDHLGRDPRAILASIIAYYTVVFGPMTWLIKIFILLMLLSMTLQLAIQGNSMVYPLPDLYYQCSTRLQWRFPHHPACRSAYFEHCNSGDAVTVCAHHSQRACDLSICCGADDCFAIDRRHQACMPARSVHRTFVEATESHTLVVRQQTGLFGVMAVHGLALEFIVPFMDTGAD